MNETPEEVKAGILAVRIATDEFEDALIRDLIEIRVAIRAGDIAKADELVTKMLDTMTEDIEDEE